MQTHVIKFLRITAGVLFLYHSIGWLVYAYPIDKSYSLYSFIMMFAYLIGVLFSKRHYQSKLGLISIGAYVVSIAFTTYYAIHEAIDGSNSALQSMSIRIFEIILFLCLMVLAFYYRRKADRE